ncbi:MAG: glycerate kinase [Cryobacterium sp.]|nr:glycerate kinase [Cryobacterium sp.]
MSRVVIAPDSFKGSVSALDAAVAIGAGWRLERPDDSILTLPQADGGEGTLAAIAAAIPEANFHFAGLVRGPDGRPVDGLWLELPGGVAVVELAQCSGLPLMAKPDPIGATTYGLGEVIGAALDAGATSLIIALGGSASTDGGAGALSALRDHVPPAKGVRLLADVTTPLLGPAGAAATFGPQKGATPEQVRMLEERLSRFAERFDADPSTPGAGAAGGAGFGFMAAWGAKLESGAEAIARLTGLDDAVRTADALITGEGSFDDTSTSGKVVGNALTIADRENLRRIVVAGSLKSRPLTPGGRAVEAISLVELSGSLESALGDTAHWLHEAGRLSASRGSN